MILNGAGDNIVLNSTRAYSEAHGWVYYPSLPVPKYWHCQVTVTVGSGSGVYVIGGFDGKDDGNEVSNSVFSLSDDQWIQREGLPTPLYDHACAVVGTKIYAIGGYNKDAGVLSSVWVMDTNTTGSSWKYGPQLPEERMDTQAFVYDNKIYLLGGPPGSTSVLTLSPNTLSWSVLTGADIFVPRSTFPAPFINKDSVHCNKWQ